MNDREDGASSDDDDRVVLSVAALEERQREIEARLRLVSSALRDAGAVSNGYDSAFFQVPPLPDYPPQDALHGRFFRRHVVPIADALWQKLSEQRFAFDLPDRFRVEWELNDLGREKCRELWELFDQDGDDAWSYTEFVEYMTALEGRMGERVEMHAFCDNEEVWRLFISDSLEANDQHYLTFNGFLRYREAIEEDRPLAAELQALEIGLEWRGVESMRRKIGLMNEYLDKEGVVTIKRLHFLAGECGLVATYHDLWQVVQRQRLYHRCHRYVLDQKRALRLFGYKQKTTFELTNPSLEEDPRVCRSGVLALILSGWIPRERLRWRSFFLELRLRSYGLLRRLRRQVSTFFEWTRRAAMTGLLRASCLQSTPEREIGDYVLKLETWWKLHGLNAYFPWFWLEPAAATLHELKYLERGAECFVYIDFQCRNGTRESDALWLCQRLTWFLELFFKDHIELLPHLFKWFITIPTKMQLRSTGGGASSGAGTAAGAAPIVRIVILFTGEMDLYTIMQSLNLPSSMQFDHLLQRLSMRWMFSHSIEEIVTNKRFIAGTQWSCRGQLDARFNRQAWGQIFRQCAMKIDDEIAIQRDERKYMARQQEELAEKQSSTASKMTSAPTANQAGVEGYREDETEDSSLSWRKWLHRLAVIVDSSRELSLTWSITDLKDLLEGNAWVKTVITPVRFQRLQQLLSTAGALAGEWRQLGESFRTEFASSRFVEATVAANTAAAMASATSSNSQARSTVTRVASRSALATPDDWSGVPSVMGQSISASFPFASPLSAPATPGFSAASPLLETEALNEGTQDRYREEDPLEHDLLELYEACVKTLQSVNCLRAEAGTSGVSVVFDGWNVFSILPRVVPMTAAKRASLMRMKSTASNGSSASGASTSTAGLRGGISTASTSGLAPRRKNGVTDTMQIEDR